MKQNNYDIICIGAGAGGLNIAGFMNRVGFKVLLIDKSDKHIGGDCLNFGCVPSKAMIHASRLIKNANDASKFGVKSSGKVNLKKVRDYVSSKVEHIRTHENASYFRKKGMDVVLGEAKFSGKNSINVNGKEYFGKKIIIATGSRPRKLNIKGAQHVTYGKDFFDNESVFGLAKLPQRLVVIGGGPIGLEIGQAFKRFGSKVTIVQSGKELLPKEDPEVSRVLHKELEKEGIEFMFGNRPSAITKKKELVVGKKKIAFDALFVSIGRELNLDLDLEKAGIDVDERGKLLLNDRLQTTNKNVLACGDSAGSYMFTHAAELHAGVIISNFFKPFFKNKINYDKLSWVTYTDPEIATFGVSEEELKKRGIDYRRVVQDFSEDDRAITDEGTFGKLILYVDKKGKILSGSMIARDAGELFQELVLAKSAGLSIKDLFNKTYPYPTATRINKRAISSIFAEKLTDRTKKVTSVVVSLKFILKRLHKQLKTAKMLDFYESSRELYLTADS